MENMDEGQVYPDSPKIFDCKQGAIRSARLNVDGTYCITCGADKSIKLWNPHRQLLLKTYAGHGFEVLDARSSTDNSQIASCSADKTVMTWDVGTGQALRKFRGHVGRVNCVYFNEESTLVLSGSVDCSVRVWDLKSKNHEAVQVMDEGKDVIMSLVVTSHEILTGCLDGRIRRYDLRMGRMFQDYVGKSITSVCFTNDGQCVLASTLESLVMLFDKETGEMLAEFSGHENKEFRCDSCLNAKDTHVISGSEDGIVYIWDLVRGKLVQKLDHQLARTVITSVTHHPKENCLITAARDKIFVWGGMS